ncbi:MAG: hypothetical protein LBM78_04235 [Clostridiales bacterium]|jgi:hypothetical protein|nr:hypothetical protein [Clostridiales bacterium]
MKKGIAIAVLFFFVLGWAITEHLLLDRFFGHMTAECAAIQIMLDEDTEHIDRPAVIARADALTSYFDGHRHGLQISVNQILINDLAYRVVSLSTHTRQNDYNMAGTDITCITENCKLLHDQTMPTWSNVL